jgi:hypothetical protein
MKGWTIFCLLCLSSCGYHYAPESGSPGDISVSIPYIKGDPDGILNNALVYELSSTGHFVCVQSGGVYRVEVEISSDDLDRVGFRYDRDNVKGTLEKNLLGVEDRRSVTAQVIVKKEGEIKPFVGPFTVSAFADYDYTDPGSPQDLLFSTSSGAERSIMQFSLGQLDSYEGAFDDASRLVFKRLSEKIAAALLDNLFEAD